MSIFQQRRRNRFKFGGEVDMQVISDRIFRGSGNRSPENFEIKNLGKTICSNLSNACPDLRGGGGGGGLRIVCMLVKEISIHELTLVFKFSVVTRCSTVTTYRGHIPAKKIASNTFYFNI